MNDLHVQIPWLFGFLRSVLPIGMHRHIDWMVIVLVVLLVGIFVRYVIVALLARQAARNHNIYDDIIVGTIRKRTLFWFLLLGLLLAIGEMPLRQKAMDISENIVLALMVASFTIAISTIATAIISRTTSTTGTGLGGTTLIHYILRFFIYLVGLAVLFSLFSISVVPYFAALGVGGLAVALAFQDTLANLFAGIYITLSQQIRIGDFISLSSGEEGFVEDISWRTTSMRTVPNNIIIVPNKKLGDAILTNYHLPNSSMSVDISVGVSYDCNPDHVERVLLEVGAEAASTVEGVLDHPPPSVRFKEFGESSLNFKLFVTVKDFSFKFSTQHELMKMVYHHFRAEGIEIPFPIRTIKVSREKESEDLGFRTQDSEHRT